MSNINKYETQSKPFQFASHYVLMHIYVDLLSVYVNLEMCTNFAFNAKNSDMIRIERYSPRKSELYLRYFQTSNNTNSCWNLDVMHYTASGKRNKNIVMNEKLQKCICKSNVLAFLFKPERTYWSWTLQLDTVVIEVSSVKVLRQRGNPRRIYGAYLPTRE